MKRSRIVRRTISVVLGLVLTMGLSILPPTAAAATDLSILSVTNDSDRASAQVTVRTESARGLRKTTFVTPPGEIVVYLAERVKAGATVTGRVHLEPLGGTAAEGSRNLANLSTYELEIAGARPDKPFLMTIEDVFLVRGRGDRTTPDRSYTWTVGVPKAAANVRLLPRVQLVLKDGTGQPVASAGLPEIVWPRLSPDDQALVALELAVLKELERPAAPGAADFHPPRFGQEERSLEFVGPFNGRPDGTSVRIGGRECPLLLEVEAGGAGRLFVESPRDVVGLVDLEMRESDVTVAGKFNNLRVTLTAAKTNLLRNETSLVSARVEGFRGLEDAAYPVPFEELNRTPQTILLQGVAGPLFSHAITRDEVSEQGLYVRDVMALGIRPGDFAITASIYCNCGGCECDVKLDKDVAVLQIKAGTFSDLADKVLFKYDNGDTVPLGDHPSLKIKFKIPKGTVTRTGGGNKAMVTRAVGVVPYAGMGHIGWLKPKHVKDPKDPKDKDKPERYEYGNLQDFKEVDCKGKWDMAEETAELMLANIDKFDTQNFVLQIDVVVSGAECDKKFSFKVTVKKDKATVENVTK